jgi:peroxiredoxin
MGELAKQQLKSLRTFSVGKKAPEIQGEDIDGVPFRLSDYRGRVVVLVFSANWCGSCRRMHKHERRLVEQLKDQPFTLLHVNSDYNRQEVKRLQEKGELTWRCFWDGPGPEGPIATKWNIDSWPEIYVLDGQGVIRYREVRGPALSVAVERLLSDLKSNRSDGS